MAPLSRFCEMGSIRGEDVGASSSMSDSFGFVEVVGLMLLRFCCACSVNDSFLNLLCRLLIIASSSSSSSSPPLAIPLV